ncbi:hypothetical protein GSI_11843 [Ganoderma sinense ZZ0214-1]|uniref:F-box domain-containing protein n=1 Tax=Ganoderma sinense ZZ0214-1 TaxID=1077348 RepID=A0A2G8RX43_9APHY|nr:hypothetical protein GSI_11843 [Ganoderma sinense ZZ0214-1]
MSQNTVNFPSNCALMNYDVLLAIFDGSYYRDRRELAAFDLRNCALACRAFNEPALRALWKTMSPPKPLWHLLAPDRHPEEIISDELYKDAARWNRFQWYARFVRELEIPHHGSSAMRDAQIIRCLLNYNGRNSFTPSLRVLSYPPESIWDDSFCALFTPRLRDVTLHYTHPFRFDEHQWIRFGQSVSNVPYEEPVRRLRDSSPHLESLRLYSAGITPNLLTAITSFEHLREARLGTINSEAFRNLVAMPKLTNLEVYSLDWDEQTLACEPICARSLRSLVVGDDASTLENFFYALDAPSLEAATLHLFRDDTDAALNYVPCLSALARAVDPAIFRALALEAGYSRGPVPELSLVELLAPLFQLRALRHLDLSGTRLPLFAEDQDFMYLALAWPKLETLSISPMSQDLDDVCQVPSPVVLDHLRMFCPNLQRLRLPYLDLRGREFEIVPPPRGRARHGLVALTIGSVHRPALACEGQDEPEPDAKQIDDLAQYLLQLFPALEFPQPKQSGKVAWPCGLGDVLATSASEPTWGKVYDRCRVLREA